MSGKKESLFKYGDLVKKEVNKQTVASVASSLAKTIDYLEDGGDKVLELIKDDDKSNDDKVNEIKEIIEEAIANVKADISNTSTKYKVLAKYLANTNVSEEEVNREEHYTAPTSVIASASTVISSSTVGPSTSTTTGTVKMGSNKLDSSTPIFSGGPKENVRNWLYVVANIFKVNQIEDSVKLAAVSPFLKGLAFQALMQHTATGATDWKGFEQLLCDLFEPKDQQRKLKLRLRELKDYFVVL